MRTLVNSLAVIGAGIAAALTLNLYLGMMGDSFGGGQDPTVRTLQFWASIAVLIAIAFGSVGRIQDRRSPKPASKLSNVAILTGLLCGALIFAMPFAFG